MKFTFNQLVLPCWHHFRNNHRVVVVASFTVVTLCQLLSCAGTPAPAPAPAPVSSEPVSSEPVSSEPARARDDIEFVGRSTGFYCFDYHCLRTQAECEQHSTECVHVEEAYCFLTYRTQDIWQACFRNGSTCDRTYKETQIEEAEKGYEYTPCKKVSSTTQPVRQQAISSHRL